jgi:hypothetical protein
MMGSPWQVPWWLPSGLFPRQNHLWMRIILEISRNTIFILWIIVLLNLPVYGFHMQLFRGQSSWYTSWSSDVLVTKRRNRFGNNLPSFTCRPFDDAYPCTVQSLAGPKPLYPSDHPRKWMDYMYQWIGLREKLQESPIFHGKIYGFL